MLAGSPYWHALTGIAVAPSGTIYVSAEGGSSGVFSLTAPRFASRSWRRTSSEGLALSGQTLYSLDSVGPVSIDTNAPFAKDFVERDIGKSLVGIAASGATLYGTWADGCTRGASGKAAVAAIDTATGLRKDVANLALCPEEPRGIAVAPDGTLVVATATRILRVNPADGSSRTLSRGGLLRNAGKLAVTSSGDVIVADASSGILRIAPTGRQSTIASGPALIGVDAVALDAAGRIYVTTPPGSPLQASAPGRQRYIASRGIRVSVACQPACGVGYRAKVTGAGPTYDTNGSVNNKHEQRALGHRQANGVHQARAEDQSPHRRRAQPEPDGQGDTEPDPPDRPRRRHPRAHHAHRPPRPLTSDVTGRARSRVTGGSALARPAEPVEEQLDLPVGTQIPVVCGGKRA